jgi:H+/Cl- antiporter ClcA
VTSSESSSSVPPLARNPIALLRTRSYVMLLVLGALVGIPVAAVAYFLLKFVDVAQQYVFVSLPDDLGWDPAPTWWPILPLMFSGLVVALTIEHLHGTAGHEPAEGFKSTGPVDPVDLPGIVLASLATLCLGAVLGPEAPLIAIGSGLGVLAVHLVKKDAPATALVVIGTAGSFAAVSTLFGSPLAGAFLLMEAAGIGGPLLGVVLTPGLLAAGVGSLIFVGLDNWTGFGTFSLSVGPIPLAGSPTVAETCWAVGIGIIAAVLGTAIKRGALALRPVIARRRVLLTPLVGIAVALLAIGFAQATDKAYSYVLFDGQSALAPLLQNAADWSVGAVVLLTACKGTAYALSLSSFRGGPVFPGMFIGAALGIALSHLPGLSMIAGVGMGIGAMTVAMLGLPMVSVLLASLLLSSDGLTLIPLIIVAVVVSYVASARLTPMSATESAADTSSTPSPA